MDEQKQLVHMRAVERCAVILEDCGQTFAVDLLAAFHFRPRQELDLPDEFCGFRSNWSSDSGGNWSAIPVGSGPGFRWELVQFLMVYRNSGPLTGMVDQIAGIGQV